MPCRAQVSRRKTKQWRQERGWNGEGLRNPCLKPQQAPPPPIKPALLQGHQIPRSSINGVFPA